VELCARIRPHEVTDVHAVLDHLHLFPIDPNACPAPLRGWIFDFSKVFTVNISTAISTNISAIFPTTLSIAWPWLWWSGSLGWLPRRWRWRGRLFTIRRCAGARVGVRTAVAPANPIDVVGVVVAAGLGIVWSLVVVGVLVVVVVAGLVVCSLVVWSLVVVGIVVDVVTHACIGSDERYNSVWTEHPDTSCLPPWSSATYVVWTTRTRNSRGSRSLEDAGPNLM
jgi:hypothetical protein